MCKCEMDPMSIIEDTEQTRFCPQTDRRTDKVKPVHFVEARGIKTELQAKEARDANTLEDSSANLTVQCASQVILRKFSVFLYSENQ